MEPVQLLIEGPVARLRLQRPEVLNAMDFEVFDELARATEALAGREDIRVVVVSGAGRSFSSGIDVAALATGGGDPGAMIARAQAGFRRLATLPMPTMAVVQGHALGAGLQLALACDLRVVAADASLGLLETNYGLIPDLGGSTLLPRLVGPARAKAMIWLAQRVGGEEAKDIGLADVVVASDELEAAASELREALVAAPAVPARAAKELIDRAHLVDIGAGMDAEAGAQERCMSSAEFGHNLMEGIQRRAQTRTR